MSRKIIINERDRTPINAKPNDQTLTGPRRAILAALIAAGDKGLTQKEAQATAGKPSLPWAIRTGRAFHAGGGIYKASTELSPRLPPPTLPE